MEHLPEELSEKDLEKYFEGDAKESSELKDVFVVFIRSAQEYQRMPNVIKFDERRGQIEEILAGFDYKTVAGMDEEELYHRVREEFEVTSKDSKNNSWHSLDIDEVTEIFIRINSKGTPLSQSDFVIGNISDENELMVNLAENAIPGDVVMMDVKDYEGFLVERRKLMAAMIEKYYKSL